MSTPLPVGVSRRFTFLLVVLVFVLGTCISTGYALWRLRTETMDRQLETAALTARAFEDQLTQSFNVIDRTLVNVAEVRRAAGELSLALYRAPYLRSISLLDQHGRVVASSDERNLGVHLSRRDFLPQTDAPVAVLRTGMLLHGRDFHDLHPAAGDDGVSFIPVARDVHLANGHWLTVVASVNTDYFLNFYSNHLPPEQGAVELLRYDGQSLLRSDNSHERGNSSRILSHVEETESGRFGETLSGGRMVLTAYRASRSYPFVLVVRLDKARVLAAWRREALNTVAIVGAILLAALALAGIYFLRFERVARERERDQAQLRIAATAFESQEGIFVTDLDGRILRVNRAFTEITGYAAEEAIGQTPHLLSSGRHERSFYAALWHAIKQDGCWQGEIWNRRKSGEVYPEWLRITAVRDGRGLASHYVSTLTDITQRKEAESRIQNLAFYDPLTGLPNRRLLLDRLQRALLAGEGLTREGALLFIDLDNFKTLNDSFGHDIGDLLLQQVAQRLGACVRDSDTVARLGGDEFVVLLAALGVNAAEAGARAQAVAEHILQALNQSYDLLALEYHCTASIGIALFRDHQCSTEELMKQADLALYGAKAAGRNTLRFFDPEMQDAVSARAELEKDLRKALPQQEFVLYYQPQLDSDGRIVGAEALVRWQHPQLGLVPPLRFIPLAEETGLIVPLGLWVLESACRQLALWAQQPDRAALGIAVNVSIRQFRQPDFVAQVSRVLKQSGAPASRLTLELTESVLLDDMEDVIAKMAALRVLGVRFALDDFGTGYSSLSYLKRLPLDELKIDQSFVQSVLSEANDAAIACTIISLAHRLGLDVLAEGVETEAQRQFLIAQGCHLYQGYLFSKPLPLDGFEQLLP